MATQKERNEVMFRVTCPVACPGMEIEPGVTSGCSCYEGKLANGEPVPEGFACDCPHHPQPSGCAEGCSHPDHKSEHATEEQVVRALEAMRKVRERNKIEITGVFIDEAKDIEKASEVLTAAVAAREANLNHAEKRLAFIGGLYAKAEVSHLKRVEATVILSATFAEMIEQTIPGLEDEERKLEPGCIARANVALMIEIAKAMHEESLAMVDAAMASSRLIVVPR
jgi:hypothetical protein